MFRREFGDGKARSCQEGTGCHDGIAFESFQAYWRIKGFERNGIDGGPCRFVGGWVDVRFDRDFEYSKHRTLGDIVVVESQITRLHSADVARCLGVADALEAEQIAHQHIVPRAVLVGAADEPVAGGRFRHLILDSKAFYGFKQMAKVLGGEVENRLIHEGVQVNVGADGDAYGFEHFKRGG